MPAVSGPYQSQLLNHVVRSVRQVAATSSELWRRASVAMTWGAQIALYPVYAVFQTTRLTSRQLRQAVATLGRSLLPAAASAGEPPQTGGAAAAFEDWPNQVARAIVTDGLSGVPMAGAAADQPIQAVLTVLTSLQWDQATLAAIAPPLTSPALMSGGAPRRLPHVQGIASSRQTRRLVLIDHTNTPLDVLSAAQRQQLTARIAWELQCYSQRQQQLQFLRHGLIRPETLPQTGWGATALTRRLYQLMAWVQRSPIAIGLNVFHESALAPVPMGTVASRSLLVGGGDGVSLDGELPAIAQWITPDLDYTLTRLEAADVSPILAKLAAWWQGGSAPATHPAAAVDVAVPHQPLPAASAPLWRRWQEAYRQWLAALSPAALVPLANDVDWELVDTARDRTRTTAAANRPAPVAIANFDLDLGLVPSAAAAVSASPAWLTTLVATVRSRGLMLVSSSSPVVVDLTAAPPPLAVAAPSGLLPNLDGVGIPQVLADIGADQADPAFPLSPTGFHNPVASPTWIEADATLLGYDYHWFERCLQILDQALLWAETAIAQLGQRLRQWWQAIGS